MKINEVSKVVGISSQTIRYYEKEGLVMPRRNPDNGYREFENKDLVRIKEIKDLRAIELSIDDINGYFDGEISLIVLLKSKLESIESSEDLKSKILRKLKNMDKELYKQVDNKIFNVEDLINVDPNVLVKVFSDLDITLLVKALKGMSPTLISSICNIRQDFDFQVVSDKIGPVRISEVEDIHEQIVSITNRLLV